MRVAQVSEDKDVQPVFRFVDEIDKTQWNAVCFSNDNEYIIGGAYFIAKKNITENYHRKRA